MLRLLDGIVDVYLPDLKYAEDEAGYLYSKVRGYKEHARRAIAEMYRQMGDELVFDDGWFAASADWSSACWSCRTILAGIRESLEWIRDELSPRVAVSLMAQYYPTHQAATSKRYTSAFAPHHRNRVAARASPRLKNWEWKKAGCRSLTARLITTAPTSPTAKRRSKTLEILQK